MNHRTPTAAARSAMTPEPVDQFRQFEAGLALAARRLTAARRRRATAAAIRSAARIALGTGVVALAASAWVRLTGSAVLWPAISAVAIGFSAITFAAIASLQKVVRPTNDEVAERLDLSIGRHNVIATALDFSRSTHPLPFQAAAIELGLAALRQHASTEPVVEKNRLLHTRTGAAASAGVAMCLLALLLPGIPSLPATLATHHDSLAMKSVADSSTLAIEKPRPDPARLPETAKPASPAKSSPNKKADANTNAALPGTSARPSASAAASPSDAGQSAASSDLTAAPQTKKPDAASRSAAAPQSPAPQNAAAPRSNPGQQKASLGQSDSDSQSNGKAAAASGSKAESSSGEKSGDKSSDSQNSGNPDSDSSPPPPGDQGGQPQGGNQSSDNPNAPDAPGSGNGRSSQSSESGGGNGQSSGQSPPKKARGVAPLLLGSRQADLLQGKQLPGPDERTRIQLPPLRQPGDPAAAASINAPQQPEPPTGVYRVPANQRAAVDAYFRQFHKDEAATN
ncbi:MAG: hypothetical protein QM754_09480 [Tepidisphaeraceae bacterium]